MALRKRIKSHISSGVTSRDYYSSMNQALRRINEEYTMLHYPLYGSDKDSFMDAQENLTDYCMALLPSVEGKILLEIGCGNGIQALYIHKKYQPGQIRAIDLNHGNIEIARRQAERIGVDNVHFHVDDAHSLESIEDNSIDCVINIESAFHYPDKAAFLRQIHRVLKPGGNLVIADILTTNRRRYRLKDRWKKKMAYHHWPLANYESELPTARINIVSITDITREVIRGFMGYRRWLRQMKRKGFIEDLMMKLYYTIHIRINVYLLKYRRQYCVIVGEKPLK